MSLIKWLVLFARFAAASDAFVAEAGEAGTDERGHDEEPHLAHGAPVFAVGEQGDAEGTGGVDRGVGQRDADTSMPYCAAWLTSRSKLGLVHILTTAT